MHIDIRQATPDDADGLAKVEIASWRAAYAGLMPAAFLSSLSRASKAEAWRQSLLKHGTTGRKRVLVAEVNSSTIGFVRVGCDNDDPAVGLIFLLYVLPDHWHHGVGTALMAAATPELQSFGVRETLLWVLRDNHRARAFYARLGWHPDGRTLTDTYDGIDLVALCYRWIVPAAAP